MTVQIDTRRLARVEADYGKVTRRIARFEALTDMIDWTAMTIAECRYVDWLEEKFQEEANWLAIELYYLTTPTSDRSWPGL